MLFFIIKGFKIGFTICFIPDNKNMLIVENCGAIKDYKEDKIKITSEPLPYPEMLLLTFCCFLPSIQIKTL